MISAKLTGGGLDWFIFSLIGKSAAARAPPPRLAKGTYQRSTNVIKSQFYSWSSGEEDLFTWPLERPPSDIMKLKSSAKLSKLDCVIGERGSRIFCCMSRAYLH